MDSLIYKTNNQFRAHILEVIKAKDQDPGPTDYVATKITKN